MSLLLERLGWLAQHHADGVALSNESTDMSWGQLHQQVIQLRQALLNHAGQAIALVGDNSLTWVVCDLALLGLAVRVVPIPGFFSRQQLDHVIAQAHISLVLGQTTDVDHFAEMIPLDAVLPLSSAPGIRLGVLPAKAATIQSYEKVTFTSGSTGTPKGVRLGLQTLEKTALGIADAMADVAIKSHLSVLPFATLLENVAGVYAPILQQVTVHIVPLAQLGFNGATHFNVFAFLQQLQRVQPQACILVPQLLMALVLACEKGVPVPSHLKFVAVGGGKVAQGLLCRAAALNLPVYEGYGLSECGSVVCLNRPATRRAGSVGKPLNHVELLFDDSGEIRVRGAVMLGYLGEAPSTTEIATGDLGRQDEEGFVYIKGRKKNLFITAYGRNVNPEWVEAELTSHPAIAQAALFGEAMPENVAVITVRTGFQWADVAAAIAEVNQRLPNYARVGRALAADEPFSPANGLATANGRNCRSRIQQHYRNRIHNGEPVMSFFEQLNQQTERARGYLLSAPVIEAVPEGRFQLTGYRYFLEQAFHHVKHTVPLMMACGGRLPQEKEWVRKALAEYIEDEYGHQEWILNDIAACGGDREAVRNGVPDFSIELMVSFLYDQIERQNPMAFFGMVMVLEGTSIKLATQMGKIVQQKLELPDQAFSYLYSHGELDQDHFEFFRSLMDKVTQPGDQQAIIHSANIVYRLYGDMLRSIPLAQETPANRERSSHAVA